MGKTKKRRPRDKDRRAPTIFYSGWKVLAPVGRRLDGHWSNRMRVEALFMDEDDARGYSALLVQRGVPSSVQLPKRPIGKSNLAKIAARLRDQALASSDEPVAAPAP